MIDLHSHILPGVDDGASDLADSVAMARQGEADGISLICATPHIRHDHDVRIHELPERVAEVDEELARRGIAVRVAPGGEVAETIVERLDDDELRAVTLGGGGRWILLEPRPGPLSDSIAETVEHLAARGFSTVVAHPERHLVGDLLGRLAELTGRGALVQGTAAMLVGERHAEGMLALARHGVLHVLGSDAHTAKAGRRLELSAGLAQLRAVERLRPHLDWIARTAPEAIVRGEPVTPPFPAG